MTTKLNYSNATWIALNANVRCSGIQVGRIVGVALDPTTYQITHLIVKEKGFIGIERMVPVYLVRGVGSNNVELICSRTDLIQLEPVNGGFDTFDEYPYPINTYSDYPMWTHGVSNRPPLGVSSYEALPPSLIVLQMSARVIATNGVAGSITGLIVMAATWQITHMKIQQTKPWGHKICAVSVNEITRVEEDAVHLQLTVNDVKQLRVTHHS